MFTLEGAYKKLNLEPYEEFAKKVILQHFERALAEPTINYSPFDPTSNLYRRIGSSTFWAVQAAIQIRRFQTRRMKKDVKIFLRSETLAQTLYVRSLIEDFVVRLGGKPLEVKCGGSRAKAPSQQEYNYFDERHSQKELVTHLWSCNSDHLDQ